MTRVSVMTTPGATAWVDYLRARIPHLEVIMDTTGNALDTFLAQLRAAGDDPVLRLEDDIILTTNFLAKAEAEIAKRPQVLIQFFSMRPADRTVGSRWDTGFLMNQCCYLPAGYARMLVEYSRLWRLGHPEYVTGTDSMVQHWLKARRERYWIHCPSLVQHRVVKSRINPKRSSKRQSLTFVDPDEDR